MLASVMLFDKCGSSEYRVMGKNDSHNDFRTVALMEGDDARHMKMQVKQQ
jgi:hypothetical protein